MAAQLRPTHYHDTIDKLGAVNLAGVGLHLVVISIDCAHEHSAGSLGGK